MKTSTKVNIVLASLTGAVVVVLAIVFGVRILNPAPAVEQRTTAPTSSATSEGSDAAAVPLVADNTHFLGATRDAPVTFVEFVDLECGACGSLFPVVEELRAKYDGRVNFAVRYFPLTSHPNSLTSATAVEAAAQQGKFEEMYTKVFENQRAWANKRESQAPLFREYAQTLGLDLAAYDASVVDPATAARIRFDYDAGRALGIGGTPSFFVNGEPLSPRKASDFTDAIDAQLK